MEYKLNLQLFGEIEEDEELEEEMEEDTEEAEKEEKEDNKPLDPFQQTIKTYLENYAKSNELFAKKYDETRIKTCCNYIIEEVRKTKRKGFADDEIYQMARHYYEEDIQGDFKSNSGQVVVNHVVELSEEEKAKAKERAVKEYERQQVELLKKEQQKEELKKQKEQEKQQKLVEKEKAKAKEKGYEQIDLLLGEW